MLSKWKSGSDTKEEEKKEEALELCHFVGVKENSRQGTVGAKAQRQRSAKYMW